MEVDTEDGKESCREETKSVKSKGRKLWCLVSFTEVVFVMALNMFNVGLDYGYEIPGSIQVTLMKEFNLTYYEYSLLNSFYSLPLIFHSFIGGFLLDRVFGISKGTAFYATVALMGSLIFTAGAMLETFWLMLIGRLFYGIGGEMTGTVCANYLAYRWFKNSCFNLVDTIMDNFGYLGSTAVFATSQRLFNLLNKSYSGKKAVDITLAITSSSFFITYISGLLMAFLKPPVRETDEDNSSTKSLESLDAVKEERKVKLTDCLHFPLVFWLLCVQQCLFNNGIITFQNYQQDMLVKEYSLSVEEANQVVSTIIIVQVVISIPLSIGVDLLGRNTAVVTSSILVAILAHCCILIKITPYISVGLIALSYALISTSIWGMFAYPLDKIHHGFGYGIVSSFMGISMTFGPMAAGKIIDASSYFVVEFFYLASCIGSLVCILLVWYLDKRSTGVLSMSAKQRKIFLREKNN